MKNYHVYLYPGFGYSLNHFQVNECLSEQHCLEKLTSHLIANDMFEYFMNQDGIEDLFGENYENDPSFLEWYTYIDATAENAPYPVYLLTYGMKMSEDVLDNSRPIFVVE